MGTQPGDMGLWESIEELERLDDQRTPVGWTPAVAVERTHAINRLLGIVLGSEMVTRRGSVPCEVELELRTPERRMRSEGCALAAGGLLVDVSAPVLPGTPLHLYLRGEHGQRIGVRARAVSMSSGDVPTWVGISLSVDKSDEDERRRQRFVLALLEHRSRDHAF